MTVQPESSVKLSGGAVSCDLTDDVMILDLSSGVYFGLEGVGSAVWRYIQEPRTIREVIEHLMSEYDVTRETCESQTVPFLQDLADRGLVVIENYASA
jgi:hypothetical protein